VHEPFLFFVRCGGAGGGFFTGEATGGSQCETKDNPPPAINSQVRKTAPAVNQPRRRWRDSRLFYVDNLVVVINEAVHVNRLGSSSKIGKLLSRIVRTSNK